MNRISLFVGSAALGLLLLLAPACSASRSAGSGSPTPNATAGTLAQASNSARPASAPRGEVSPPPPTPMTQTAQSEEDKLPRVNAADAKRLVEAKQAILVDVRSQAAYDASHAQGALHLDVTDIEAGKHKELPRDKEIIPYCT